MTVKKGINAFHPQKKRSVARALTSLLTLTVVVVSFFTTWVIYQVLAHREYAALEQKAEDFIASIDNILEMPLWNFDYENIQKIAEAYTDNSLFEKLKIVDEEGRVCFDFSRDRSAATVEKSTDISHEGKFVGRVEMSYTTQNLVFKSWHFIFSAIGGLLIVVLAMATAIGFFFRSLLKKIFRQMDRIAIAYSSGENIKPGEEILPYMEFQPLISILRDMHGRLDDQIHTIQAAEKKYRSIFENAFEGIFQSSPDGQFISANPALAKMLGYDSPQSLIRNASNIGTHLYLDPDQREEYVHRMKEGREVFDYQVRFHKATGGTAWLSLYSRPFFNDGGELAYIEGMALDTTRQKAEEEERNRLEQQLLHSQRLESVGRLAGGVAHDFNNMLSIIIGYAEMMLEDLPGESADYERISEIKSAADRSADLTRQLLAFARKQTIEPRVLNLNDIVQSMLKMLQRLLGENINLTFSPGSDLAKLRMDPAQIDQVLANLCINARDAISGTGTISISTKTVELDEIYCKVHPDATPGAYVMLCVCDNGCGMEKSVLDQIFEPFFTTKEMGKGTGLGLATVYGIVKQNLGHIHVYSELHQGTTFKLYFPVFAGAGEEIGAARLQQDSPRGTETVLLVEDEPSLLSLGQSVLEKLGYTVLPANSPSEALRISATYPKKIDLLMTDMVMPDMSGRELSAIVSRSRPDIRCLYVSGYAADVIANQNVLEPNFHFIPKPFNKKTLAVKLRAALSESRKTGSE